MENNNEMNNNLNNSYYEPKNNNGVKVLLVILILLVLVGIGLLSYKMFVLDKKDDNKEASNKVEEKVESKEEINKKLKSIALDLRASSSKSDLGINAEGDYFKNFDMKYNYVKYDMYQNNKVQVTTGMDENDNLIGETYSKCNNGIGSASIKVNEFINYYEKIFGERVDETLLKNNNINIVDNYICATIPSFIGDSSILKIIEKSKDGDIYSLNIAVLSNTDNNYYLDESIVTWPEEVQKAKLLLKYKLNNDGSYKIESLKVQDLKGKSNSKEDAYIKYLNKLSSEVSSKYTKNGDQAYPSSKYQYSADKIFMSDLSYYVEVAEDKTLKINDKKIADNVLEYFIADNGNGGYRSLYYIDGDGNIYSVDHEFALSDNTSMTPKKLSYKNIVAVFSGINGNAHSPIFVDIEGNVYIGER